jgi:signal transduction histidine kinase
MPLGLPSHLAARTTITAVARAGHAVAGVSLVAVGLIVVSLEAHLADLILWPALLALVPMAALLILLERSPSKFIASCYLVIGGLCVFWFTLIGSQQLGTPIANDAYTVQMLKIALIMVVGVSPSSRNAIAWTTAGYLLGELATFVALTILGAGWIFDSAPLTVYLAVVGVFAILGAERFTARTAQSVLFRAARDEQLAEVRAVFESRATALLHDTVLNQLAVVTSTTGNRLPPGARAGIENDLATIVGEEWFTVDPLQPGDDDNTRKPQLLRTAIAEAANELEVTISGELSVLEALGDEVFEELSRAIAQSVSNVRRHARTTEAEVIIAGAGDEVSAMVIDAGVGFDHDPRIDGGLGVGASIVGRLATVGGSATVWSQSGSGTSVLLRVPTSGRNA